MATQHKKIGKNEIAAKKGTYLNKDNWEVMKPFVHFGVKAMTVIGSALVTIVKNAPKALEHKPEEKKKDRIIKI
jgi:hypothetical protein